MLLSPTEYFVISFLSIVFVNKYFRSVLLSPTEYLVISFLSIVFVNMYFCTQFYNVVIALRIITCGPAFRANKELPQEKKILDIFGNLG